MMPAETFVPPLSVDELRQVADLRHICEVELLRPPSVEECREYLSVPSRSRWQIEFLIAREGEAFRLEDSLYSRLTHLDRQTARTIVGLYRERRYVVSPCGPPPLLLTRHDGTVILAELGSGSTFVFDPVPARRRWFRGRR